MRNYKKIENLTLLRLTGRIFPLKHKLAFMVKKYLKDNTDLAIRYYGDWHICTTVTSMNRSTLEDVIIGGTNSQPEKTLIADLQHRLPDEMVMIDVGGNIGSFFCQFIDKCKEVFVFEPIPRLNTVIKRSKEYNNDKKVTVVEKAAGSEKGVVRMLDNNNSNIVSEDRSDVLDIEVTTLDDELVSLSKIDFIKIDVEGYEVNVLKGAERMIQKHRPYILVEVHPFYLENYGQDTSDVIEFLKGIGYKISYYSFLTEQRMHRFKRIVSRWKGNRGVKFSGSEDFLKDIPVEPRLSSYHFYCEPD